MSTKRQRQLDDWLSAKQSKKTNGSKGKYLIGVKGYFAEIAEESSYGELEVRVDGVEFIYSSGPSTKCGDCTGRNTSELISIEKGEHIVGVDFGELGYDDDDDSYKDEVSADGSAIEGFRTSNLILYLTCTTTRWVGRIIKLYSHNGKPNADGDAGLGPYVGLYDKSRAGEKFTCNRGMRVTGIVFEDGMITGTMEDTIPRGENDKWWESHCGYKPWENLKFSLDPNAPYKYLAGVRGCFNEDQKYCDDGCVIGVELIYSDGTSTKCGNCTGKRISEIVPFEKDEHIIGIDFEQSFPPVISQLTLYTSHPSGRKVEFWVGEYEACADDEKGPYIGVHRAVGMVSGRGKRFTCKRGKRVTGIEWDYDGSIKLMTQEKIPEGQNDKWWQKSHGYKKKATAGKDKPYAVGVKVCTAVKEGVGRIVGLELELSDGFLLQWGREGTKESGQMGFEKNEHIIGIDFDADDDGVTSLELFTSNFGGRSLNFSVIDNGDVRSDEDFGCYVGVHGNSFLSRKEKKFTCERGNRVTGLTFAKCTITNMKQEKIPEGCNERWWERSLDYVPDRDPEKKNKSGKKPKKTKGYGSLSDESDFDEAKHNHIMAEVKRQHRLVMAGYECEYDSEGNYNPTDYHSYSRPSNRCDNGGCYGFSSRDCDDLLAQGVKPWDDDADNVLSAMRGRW